MDGKRFKGIEKSFLVKLIASNLLAIEYKDNEYEDIFHRFGCFK